MLKCQNFPKFPNKSRKIKINKNKNKFRYNTDPSVAPLIIAYLDPTGSTLPEYTVVPSDSPGLPISEDF